MDAPKTTARDADPAFVRQGSGRLRSNKTIASLEAGRGIAALAVATNHSAMAVGTYLAALPPAAGVVFLHGYLGVDFFFVLSGFIIYYTNHGKRPDQAWARHYGESRLTRIFVPYLPIGIGIAVAYTLLPWLSSANRDWSWFASVTLLPSPSPTALSVAWTLRHELIFYALFLIAFRLGRPLTIVAIWAALCAGYTAIAGDAVGAWSYPFGLINVEFLAGMLAAQAIISSRFPRVWSWLLVGAAFIAAFVATNAAWSPLLGIGLACWIVPIVRAERAGHLSIPPALKFLGAASYSIYLVHVPVIALAARAMRHVPAMANWPLSLAALVLLSALGGIAYHLAWERWALRAIKREHLRTPRLSEQRS